MGIVLERLDGIEMKLLAQLILVLAVAGFSVISSEPDEYGIAIRVTAEIRPRTAVNCLCVAGCDVELVGIGSVSAPSGGTVVVREGPPSLHGQGEAGNVRSPPQVVESP